MGCLFSCCTTDPVKAAKWKQRSTSYKKVNEKDEPPAVTYIYTPPGQEGKDVPDHQVDTSGVSSEGNDRGLVETKVIVVNAYKTTTTTTTKVISDAYDERFEETASLRESLDPGEKAPDLPQGVVESHVISQTQIQTVIEHHDEYDDDDMKPSECVTNDEASDGEAAGAASARAAGTGDEDERGEDAQSERDEDGKNERSEDAGNEGLGQTDDDASSRLPQELRLEVADIDNVDAKASQFQSKTVLVFTETPVMSDEESLEGVLRGLIAVEDFNVASPESTDEISDDNAEISQDNAEGETPNESDRWIGPFSPEQTAAAECDDGSDSFPLVYSQIDIDVIRKIWEDLVPNGDVAPLGVKILLRVFDEENKRIRDMVSAGLSRKFNKSRPIMRSEVELTLGRAVLGLLETSNQNLTKEKMDFGSYQVLGGKYYDYGVSFEFGKAIDDVLVAIMEEETGNRFTSRQKMMWASFCCHITTNVDIGYTKARKQKK